MLAKNYTNSWKNSNEEQYLMTCKKSYEIEILVFINKILLEHSSVHSFKYMTAFALQMAEFIVATEIVWLANPKIFYYLAHYRKSLPTLT